MAHGFPRVLKAHRIAIQQQAAAKGQRAKDRQQQILLTLAAQAAQTDQLAVMHGQADVGHIAGM